MLKTPCLNQLMPSTPHRIRSITDNKLILFRELWHFCNKTKKSDIPMSEDSPEPHMKLVIFFLFVLQKSLYCGPSTTQNGEKQNTMNNLNIHRVTEIVVSEINTHVTEPSETSDGGSYSHRQIAIKCGSDLFTINLFSDTVFIDDGITVENLTINAYPTEK